jgi:hypothetical protein
MISNLEARDSNGKQIAVDSLSKILSIGVEQQNAVIQRVLNTTIVDKLVDPRAVTMEEHDGGHLCFRYDADKTAIISDHALGQMCSVARIPKTYVNLLTSECVGMSEELRKHLICYLFNNHFHYGLFVDKKGNRAKFLHRLVDDELCGFQSRNYNRKLGTKAMLRPFLEECAVHQAKPAEAYSNRLRVSLKCVLPVVFEPVDGEFVAFGATYTNSDFGAANLLVQGTLLRISSGSSSVLEGKLRKIHLGAVISENEIELSEATLEKESQTHMSAVRDMVRDVFSEGNIKRSLAMVKYSIENKVPWEKLKNMLGDVLNQSEMTSVEEMLKSTKSGIIDLPPVTSNKDGDPEANAWWASAVLGVVAARTTDTDRKAGMQELAGKLLKSP